MAAPTITQTAAEVVATTGTTNIVFSSSVTAGSTLIIALLQTQNSLRSYSVSDNINGSWGAFAVNGELATGISVEFYSFVASASGSITVTVTQDFGFIIYRLVAFEISASTLDVTGSDVDATNQANHHCAASGSIDTAANVIVFSVGVLNAAGGTLTPNASCTQVTTSSNTLLQHRRSASALTDERSTWTSSTARNHACASISFAAAAGGPAALPPRGLRINQAMNRASTY